MSVFAALSDPNRRRIMELLASGGPDTATALASELDISRQAAAKHLVVLADAGLASPSRHGRETRFHPRAEALSEVTAWVAAVERDWGRRLQRLAQSVEASAPPPPEPQRG